MDSSVFFVGCNPDEERETVVRNHLSLLNGIDPFLRFEASELKHSDPEISGLASQ